MITVYHGSVTGAPASQLDELRRVLRQVLRGLWHRRRPPAELLELVASEPPLGPRHVSVLAHVAAEGDRTVSEIARDLGLSLPAASKLTRDLADHRLVRRREDADDRRRTVVDLDDATAAQVRAWLRSRNRPLERALAALDEGERAAFLKGLHALADALMEESACGPVRPHHRAAHRRRSHPH
jgi:DNA-binding MarR family transcriptional regulator